jgi:hypothetical protein
VGAAPLQYTWRFNSITIPGANAPTLNMPNVSESYTGSYDVIIANSVGSATSRVATLTVGSAIPLTLVNPRRSNNVFSAVLTGGTTGRGYSIEVSTNLDTWAPLTTVSNITGEVSFTDTNPAPRRTYRARMLQ